VASVCEQRQRVRRDSPHDFGNHVRSGQRKCHGQPSAVAGHVGGGRVMLVMLMPHLDSVLTTP